MKTDHSLTVPCALLLIALCLFIRYHINRRRFNRRSVAGLQHFNSYHHFLVITAIEKIIMITGNICGFAELLLLAVAGIKHLKF